MTRKIGKSTLIFIAATVIILAAGAAFWLSDLSSDPPMFYSGMGQSLTTDPYMYVFHARNKILYGQADPYDFPYWIVFKYSLVSLASYVWFSLTSISQVNANALGVVLSLGGLLFFLLGLYRHHRPWILPAVAFVYVINVTLFTLGRLPYLENGLLFIAGILFFVYSWWGDRLWGIVATGVLAGLAMLIGKIFGALLFPALLLSVLSISGGGKVKKLVASLAAFAGTAVVFLAAVYGRNMLSAFSFFGEQSYGLHGYPPGLTSPWSFVEHFVTFGFKNRLFYRSPDILMFLLFGGLIAIFIFGSRDRLRQLPRTTVFSLYWAAVVFLGLMPHAYSPMRYALLLIPAVIISCFTLFDLLLQKKEYTIVVPKGVGLAAAGVVFWIVGYEVFCNIFYFNETPGRYLVWAILPVAAVLAFAARLMAKNRRLTIRRPMVLSVLIVVLLLSATANGFRIRRTHMLERNYNIAEANSDLKDILGPDAVIAGPYASALTINNRLRPFLYFFGGVETDSTLFDTYPITHIAVDESNLAWARQSYPAIDSATVVTKYWIRNVEVQIFYVADLFGNKQAHSYQPTAYERAAMFMKTKDYDSAMAEVTRHLAGRRQSKSVGKLLADIYIGTQQYDKVLALMTQMARTYPTDFHILMGAGQMYTSLGLANNNQMMVNEGNRLLDAAVKVNRYKAQYINQWALTIRRQAAQTVPATP